MWFLSPSGWPTSADDGSLFAQSLFDRGWQVMDASEVQAAIDAYNAGQVLVPTPPDYVDDDELAAAIGGIAAVPDATSSVKGKVRLTGDLGGTADAPTVPGLADKADAVTVTAALGNKVNLSAFTAGLATKANVDDVPTAEELAADPVLRAAFGLPLARTAWRIEQGLPLTIVAVGDSILEGTTVTSGGGVLGVDDALSLVTTGIAARSGAAATPVNRAISGYTAAASFYNGKFDLAVADRADLYIIGFGHNDVRSDNTVPGTGYPKTAMVRAVEKMIRRLRDEVPGADIVLMLENPYTAGSGSNPKLQAQNVLLRPLAAFYGCAVADTYTAFTALGDYAGYSSDGGHPNRAGHAVLADTILAQIPTVGYPTAPPAPAGDLYGAARMGRTWQSKTASETLTTNADPVRYNLSGTWDSTTVAPHTSTTAGAAVRVFAFGDEVLLRLDCGTGQGSVTISVDNQVNLYSIDLATYDAGSRYIPLTGLGQGAHNITISVVSGSVTFRGAAAPARTGYSLNLADTTKLVRTGTWTQTVTVTDPNGLYLQSSTLGDSVTATIYGTGLALTHNHYASNQQIEYQVDGGAWNSKEVSIAGLVGGRSTPTMVVSGLPLGRHTISVRSVGARSSFIVYDVTAIDETATGYRRDSDLTIALRGALA